MRVEILEKEAAEIIRKEYKLPNTAEVVFIKSTLQTLVLTVKTIQSSNKLLMIKLVRSVLRNGLAEAKELVEAGKDIILLQTEHPEEIEAFLSSNPEIRPFATIQNSTDHTGFLVDV